MTPPTNNISMASNNTLSDKSLSCNKPIETLFVGLLVLLIFALVATFFGNLLVISAVVFFRRLRSVTNYFVVSLAVSDFLLSLLSLPFRIHQNWNNAQWCLTLELCITWVFLDSICTYASMWNLVMISIDRYIVISRPYKYHSLITKKVGYGMISFVWIFSIFLAFLMFINWKNYGEPHFDITRECSNRDPVYLTVVVSLAFFLPLVIIIIMYGKVFQIALIQSRELAALRVTASGNQPQQRARKRSINLIREMKATKTLAVVVGCFIVCWLPFNVILMILLWDPLHFSQYNTQFLMPISLIFIYILPILNSTMNPIIYALMNREFRSAFGNLGRRVTGRRLGAVGGADPLWETTTRTCSILTDNNLDPHTVRFSDHDSDSSAYNLPKLPQSNEIMSSNSAINNEPVTSPDHLTDTRTICSPLDDDKNNKPLSQQNGYSLALQTAELPDDDVTDDVDNDVIENAHAIDLSNRELSPLKESRSSSLEASGSGLGLSGKHCPLPPIESNRDTEEIESNNNQNLSVKSNTKLNVTPSPDCSRKADEQNRNSSENPESGNTLLE